MPSTLRATLPGAAVVMANTPTETRNIVNSISNNLRKMNFAINTVPYGLPPVAGRLCMEPTATGGNSYSIRRRGVLLARPAEPAT
jgi:hypothetical protein